MEVLRITGDDGYRLKKIRLAALRNAPSAFGSTYESEVGRPDSEWAERAVTGATGSDRAMFFARLAGEVVGLAGGYREEPTSTTVDVVSMWVEPTVRGRGVGAQLVDAVTVWATETGATNISLWVTRGNVAAERLYESKGFVETGELQPLSSDPSKDEARMQRSLL